MAVEDTAGKGLSDKAIGVVEAGSRRKTESRRPSAARRLIHENGATGDYNRADSPTAEPCRARWGCSSADWQLGRQGPRLSADAEDRAGPY